MFVISFFISVYFLVKTDSITSVVRAQSLMSISIFPAWNLSFGKEDTLRRVPARVMRPLMGGKPNQL